MNTSHALSIPTKSPLFHFLKSPHIAIINSLLAQPGNLSKYQRYFTSRSFLNTWRCNYNNLTAGFSNHSCTKMHVAPGSCLHVCLLWTRIFVYNQWKGDGLMCLKLHISELHIGHMWVRRGFRPVDAQTCGGQLWAGSGLSVPPWLDFSNYDTLSFQEDSHSSSPDTWWHFWLIHNQSGRKMINENCF